MELKLNEKSNNISTLEKNKELLISLIKQKLEMRLSKLERRNKMHLTLMNVTIQSVKEITDWSTKANNQIKEKLKKTKPTPTSNKPTEKTSNKTKKYEKVEVKTNARKQSFRSKTPLRTKTSKPFIPEETTKTLTITRNYSKSNKYFTLNPKSNSFMIKKKKKKITNFNSINNINLENEVLQRPSVISNKSNKSVKSNKSATKKNKNIETPLRKKTPFKKKNINEKNERNNLNIKLNENKTSENIINSRIIKNKKRKKSIKKMETALQKGEYLNNNDPLLIAPITDLDFYIDKKLSNASINLSNSDMKEKEKTLTNYFNRIDEKNFIIISDYLNIDDLIKLKNISKYFHTLFIIYIKNYLQKERLFFNKKLTNLNISETKPQKHTLSDFTLSKKSFQAIELLNLPEVNKFFSMNSSVNDISLIIYRIFFQLIKHPIKNIEIDKKEEFWEKCRYYFSHENKGKVGDLLKNIFEEKKIFIDGNNLYKIYKIVYKNLDKIYPKYFRTFCANTGLITFLIKEILDFVGISNDENTKVNSYWTYNDIIDSLDNKIDYFSKSIFT